ncbi:MAG: hypothetical protein FJ308_01215 [Planctomycetes bacterium]|nr:hypothetical protein [Planctomycetota bacterium]
MSTHESKSLESPADSLHTPEHNTPSWGIYSEGIERAIAIAVHFHRGQRDKAGECYLLHLLRVMLSSDTHEAQQVGVLHDVLEDTAATPTVLSEAGVSDEIIEAVMLLTKPQEMHYSSYIARLAKNPLAAEVKRNDLRDNYSIGRVAYRSEATAEDAMRIQRYVLAYHFLSGNIDEPSFFDRMSGLE